MKLSLNKNDFVNYLLNPVSKIADNIFLEFEEDTKVKTLVSSSDNSTILLGHVTCKAENSFKCIIPDCKTFLRLFSAIEKQEIQLNIDSNFILYKDKALSFKYHLLDESYIVNKKSISEEKLKQLSFDTTFKINRSKISELIKFHSIVPDAEKVYFYTEDKNVFAKLGDEQKANTNEIVLDLNAAFEGTPMPQSLLPVNIQNVLLFAFCEDEIQIQINHELKIFKFSTPNLQYIVSGLVK